MIYDDKIGRFELRQKIGHGGIGEVFLAFDPPHQREVALKVVDTNIADGEMLEAEKQGAEIQEWLSREVPQIAHIYEVGQVGEHFFIAMEYVRGSDLSDLLRRSPLAVQKALSCAIQLCQILEDCSRVSLSREGRRDLVIHGDIKPQNIRIDEDEQVRLLDFGVAKRVSLTQQYTGNVFGSLPYLSPERLAHAKVGIQADLWSVAVVLYEMLTGELPYPGDSDEEIKVRLLQGGLPQPPSPRLPAKLTPILAKCLEVNPSLRFASAAELRTELERFLLSAASQAERSQETQRTVPPSPPGPAETAEAEAAVRPAAGWGSPVSASREDGRRPVWARIAPEAFAQLRQFHDRLRLLRSRVPTRARRFHSMAADRNREVERVLFSRWRWMGREARALLEDHVERLKDVSEPLKVAIREAEQIEKEVHVLDRGAQTLSDPRAKSWLSSRFQGWASALRQIGAETYSRRDLPDDQDRLQTIRDEVRLYAQVLTRLDEAERVLSLLGATAQTAPLSASLPDLWRQLEESAPADDWFKRIQELLQPLREAVKEARDPFQELEKLTPLLLDLQRWAELLKEAQPEVAQLEQRRRKLGSGSKLVDVDALARDCDALQRRFVQQAGEARDRKVEELEKRLTAYTSVCEAPSGLEEGLRGLKRMRLESAHIFTEWQHRFEPLDALFESAVHNRESDLEAGLAQAAGKLGEKLRTLRGQPLSDETRQAAVALEDELRELAPPVGVGLILGRLRQCGELEGRIERLRQQATADLQDLYRQQQALRELNEAIQMQARRIGLEISDLSQRIDELDEGAKEPSLKTARQLADSLSSDLESLQRRFEEQSRSLLAQRLAETRAATEALARIGHPLSAGPAPELGTGASPAEIAEAVLAAGELTRQAQDAADQAFLVQEEYLQSARSILELENRQDLGPDERGAAARLLAQIEQDLAATETGVVVRLERRWQLIEACRPLLSNFHADQRTPREWRDALQERLQRQAAQDLRRFCPELADRAAGLIYGIPEQLRDWKPFQSQLAQAERLLTRLERQSAHLAAEELSRAVQSLRERGGERRQVDALLAELDHTPRELLPPWPLRRRVLDAWERQTSGDRP